MRGSISLELILRRDGENPWHEPDALRRLESLSNQATAYTSDDIFIGNAFSVEKVLKEINRALNENRLDHYAIPEPRELVAQEFLLFENSGSDDLEDFVDSQWQEVRLTLKAPMTDSVYYADAIPELRQMAKETMGPDTEVVLTGIMPLLFRTMTAVNVTMLRSYVIAFSVITVLMVLMISSVKLGLIAMIPNLLPILLALGLMGVAGMPMDTFTLMIASISLGLAVDDTIHFMHNYRRYLALHGDSRIAIQQTLATAGRAMLFTTLVLSTSFVVFGFSEMTNIHNFGVLTSFAIAMAFLADIFFAPALMHLIHRGKDRAATARNGLLRTYLSE
jgi:predicted RND superfamily exporter protein